MARLASTWTLDPVLRLGSAEDWSKSQHLFAFANATPVAIDAIDATAWMCGDTQIVVPPGPLPR
jgi:hypothetical protein